MANVKFEYLFLDIEWNQAPKTTDIEEREPVQIGIVAADANLNIKRTFSKSIRLSNRECFNQNTFTVSHYPLDAIMKSKSEETVLKNMNISFQNYKYIVVWTNETYELLKRRTDKYGISMPRHRVIILQQLLMQIAGDGKKVIGFEKSLKQARIKYQKNYLHYSKHDVNYLYLLFCKCYGEYRKLTEQETCYLNPRTHKVHNGNCRYADSALIKSSKDVIFQGNKVCKVCGCENDWNRFHWKTNIKIKRKYNIKDIREREGTRATDIENPLSIFENEKQNNKAVYDLYMKSIGDISPVIKERLDDLVETYGSERVIVAVNTTAENGGNSIKYVETVAAGNLKKEVNQANGTNKRGNGTRKAQTKTDGTEVDWSKETGEWI